MENSSNILKNSHKRPFDLEKALESLNMRERIGFNIKLSRALKNKKWCESNGIDYLNPDKKQAQEIVYRLNFNFYPHFTPITRRNSDY